MWVHQHDLPAILVYFSSFVGKIRHGCMVLNSNLVLTPMHILILKENAHLKVGPYSDGCQHFIACYNMLMIVVTTIKICSMSSSYVYLYPVLALQLVGFRQTFWLFWYLTWLGFCFVCLTVLISNFVLKVLHMPYACLCPKENAVIGGSQNSRVIYFLESWTCKRLFFRNNL
jgi:hypothetical protein